MRACRSSIRLTTCAFTETSRAETASSATIRRGSTASARAMQMRWRWPPENSCGKRLAMSGSRPTRLRRSATLSRASERLARLLISSGSAIAAPTFMRGLSEANGSWKIICMRLRCSRNSPWPSLSTSTPSSSTEPESGSTSRSTERPVVDLPQPDSPTSASVSPAFRLKETFSTACTRPLTEESRPERISKRVVSPETSSTGRSAAWTVSGTSVGTSDWPVRRSTTGKRIGRPRPIIEPSRGTAESSDLV